MKTVLITGQTGQLGRELARLVPMQGRFRCIFADRQLLPLDDEAALEDALAGLPPVDYCLHAAAYTAVDKAEQEEELAFRVNELSTAVLARWCEQQGAAMLYVSSDYVYHNTENRPLREEDACTPRGVYARSKYAGERAALEFCSRSIIVRTSWVYSSHGQNFVKTMLRLSAERSALNIVADQIGTPTYAADLAQALMQMLQTIDEQGGNAHYSRFGEVYNYSNEGACSWYDFAEAIFDERQSPCQAQPIRSEQYPAPAQRPAYSLLDKQKIKSHFALSIAHWRDALRRCLRLLPLLLMLFFLVPEKATAQKKWRRLTTTMQQHQQPFFFYSWLQRGDTTLSARAQTGDQLQIQYTLSRLKNNKNEEEVLLSSYDQTTPVLVQLPPPSQDIFFTAALRLLRKGERLRVIVPADSVRGYLGEVDKFFKPKHAVVFTYELIDIRLAADIRAANEATKQQSDSLRRRMQLEVNDLITGQGQASRYEIIPTEGDGNEARSLMYRLAKQGSGTHCKNAKSYTVQYLCLTYPAGTLIDDSFQSGSPIEVSAKSRANYISGFIAGCDALRGGSEAILWIPARLAYGSKGAGNAIAPNTDLLFWVRIEKVQP